MTGRDELVRDAERYQALRKDVATGTGLYSHSRFGPVCATPEQLDEKADVLRSQRLTSRVSQEEND